MIEIKAKNVSNSPAIASFFNEDIDYFSRWLTVHVLIRGALIIEVIGAGFVHLRYGIWGEDKASVVFCS